MQHPDVILSTRNLSVGYRSGKSVTTILHGLDLTLRRGELVCLLGANGIGKSTLLRTLSGVQAPLSGEVTISGRDMTHYSPKELSRLISIVYTDRTLAGALTVNELVSLGRHPYTGFLGRLDHKDRTIISHSLDAVGMRHKADCHVATLSDGERQKVMIARALAQEAPVIILDEPTAFLDVASRIDTMRQLHSLACEHGKAILLSSHDINCSLSTAGRLWLLRHDRTMSEGVTEDMIMNGELESLFSDNRKVSFDRTAGDFHADTEYLHTVSLDCDDTILRHWITNALHRNKIETGNHNSPINITATSATHITVNGIPATSISQMLDMLHARL
ncbi:MAG: ABC transporter ATP-binding protein [Muribaculaceae bacterium]|nr:ABC transporter ATP-binding protein [Muribaculaceae bacterium]